MDRKRNCYVELLNYIESFGINVNVAKNKAKGHCGFFLAKNGQMRIDISKHIAEKDIIPTLLHEFAHYIHYKYDSNFKSLDFIFPDLSENEYEELLSITVNDIPKTFAKNMYDLIDEYKNENDKLLNKIKKVYSNFSVNDKNNKLIFNFSSPYNYFLKYDSFKYNGKLYSLKDLSLYNIDQSHKYYLKIMSNLRFIRRIKRKINKLNKYYTQVTELWARFFVLFFINKALANVIAPNLFFKMQKVIESNKFVEINGLENIFNHYKQNVYN